MKFCKRIVAAVLVAALFALCIPAFAADAPEYPEVPEGYDGYVTFAVSALTMGWTYLIDPVLVPVHEGETFQTVTERAFDMLDWGYTTNPNSETFYLTGIACYETEPMIPDYLMNEILAYPEWAEENTGWVFGEWTGEFVDDEMLSDYEYCTLSGWMFTENNVSASEGADTFVITVGAVYTWIFSIYGWGMDYGISDGWGCFAAFDNPMEGVDRTEVSRGLAQMYADEELAEIALDIAGDELIAFLIAFYDPEATQEEIDETYAALVAALYGGEEFETGDVNMDGVLDTVDVLLIMRYSMDILELSDDAVALADYNGDGAVDLIDALILLRAVMA